MYTYARGDIGGKEYASYVGAAHVKNEKSLSKREKVDGEWEQESKNWQRTS